MGAEALLILWLLRLPGATAPEAADPLPAATVVVTRTQGQITAEAPDGSLVPLRAGRLLPGGSKLSIPPGGSIALVCSNERRALLEGPGVKRSGQPGLEISTGTACAHGDPLLPGTYRALALGDRDLALERSRKARLRVLRVNTRGSEEDDPRVPVLLAPRETAVRDPRPEIRWTRVPGAREYVVKLLGPQPWTERLRADEVDCQILEHPPGRLEVCAVPWPESAPELTPGETVFLTVGARTGVVTPLRSAEEHAAKLLSPEEASQLVEGLVAIEEAQRPQTEAALRTATLLSGNELRDEATTVLRESLLSNPSAAAYLVLGGLELERDLPRAALRSFQAAIQLASGDEALITEAEAGISVAKLLLSEVP